MHGVPAAGVTDLPPITVCGSATASRVTGSTKPYNRRQPLVRPLCGPFHSSEQTLYNKCVNTRNEMPSTQVRYVLSLMLQHVSRLEGHLESRRCKIYKYGCADL